MEDLRIIRLRGLREVQAAWRRIYADNRRLTPFQSFDFCKNIARDYVYRAAGRITPCFYAGCRGSEVRIIAPLCYDGRRGCYKFLNDCNGSDYCGFVCESGVTREEEVQFALRLRLMLCKPLILNMFIGGGWRLAF